MRGYQDPTEEPTMQERSIPADAGLPMRCRCDAVTSKVYPRGCGATRKWRSAGYSVLGLSPRMRGYHDHNDYSSGL